MQSELSDRELLIITLASKGYTDDMIARELGIKRGTVNSYWVRVRAKLGPLSRTELVARFVQKNADQIFSNRGDVLEAEAADLADKNQDLLNKASAEIARLKKRLSKYEGSAYK